MENLRISLQYSPSFMQDTVALESMEENQETRVLENDETLQPEAVAPIQEPEETSETVYFHLTPPAIESLEGVLVWSKILLGCTALFLSFQILALLGVFLKLSNGSFSFDDVIMLISTGLSCWAFWQALQFNRNMDQALKHNDNLALSDAFHFQAQFFKWVFLNILITIGLGLLTLLF